MRRMPSIHEFAPRAFTTPDMTVSDAAETMEHLHRHELVVGDGQTPVGLLTNEEIVAKVLATGRDPREVRVGEVMLRGRLDSHGIFQIDDVVETVVPLWDAERLDAREEDDARWIDFVEGRCEECGVFSDNLHDHEGLLMCGECSDLRSALFA
jgi:hypothetical protein